MKQNEEEKTTNGVESDEESESYLYELIGVTVHTGTAEGGHYYSFIRERDCEYDGNLDEEDTKEKNQKW